MRHAVALLALLTAACGDVGSAVVENGRVVQAKNDRPFPVLSASKIIPAAMALEMKRTDLEPLIRKSVIDSDNQAGDELTEALGGKEAVQAWMRSKGLRPYFTATEAEMLANPKAMMARPSELALTLYRIKSPELIELMAQTKTGNDRLRKVYPGIPHKSGTYSFYLVDVGIAGGREIAVMGERVTPSVLARAAP